MLHATVEAMQNYLYARRCARRGTAPIEAMAPSVASSELAAETRHDTEPEAVRLSREVDLAVDRVRFGQTELILVSPQTVRKKSANYSC